MMYSDPEGTSMGSRNSRFRGGAIIFGERRPGGFTLIELIVVIVFIAVIVAIAAPSFTEWRKNMDLKAAARDVASSFQFARLEAARRAATVTIVVTPGGSGTGQWIVFADDGSGGGTAGDGVRNGSEPLLQQMPVAKGVTLSATPLTTYQLNNRGFTVGGAAGAGTITLTNGSRFYRVTLSPAGAVQISGPTST
jgi:type IV fimbrial biogenesis protein FimT